MILIYILAFVVYVTILTLVFYSAGKLFIRAISNKPIPRDLIELTPEDRQALEDFKKRKDLV
jgi:hypothetical protein